MGSGMKTIEEAWERLQQAYLAAGFAAISGSQTTTRAAFAAHADAACALALAVLEEARHHGTADSTVARLRARIERLA